MDARITAVAGPLAGKEFSLQPGETCFGREASAQVSIADGSVSRRHCTISARADGEWVLRDLASHNGTLVNGTPVTEHPLAHGDEISIGSSRFIFLLPEGSRLSSVRLRQGGAGDTRSMVRLRVNDSFYLRAGPPDSPSPGVVIGFQSLLKIAAAMRASMAPEALASEILRLTAPAVSAEAAALLLFEEDEPPTPIAVWDGDGGAGTSPCQPASPTMEIPSALMERVRAEGEALLAGDSSLLAVPLTAGGRVLGLLYLAAGTDRFSDGHLQLAAAVGSIVGPVFEDARGYQRLQAENRRLQTECNIDHGMIGECAAARDIYRFIARVGPTASTVLLLGESGTGKELAARAIHRNSPRAARAFVAINCAALTESLLESELFGHERGAFTGAAMQKKGKLEVADGGTLFLDEVGELPLQIQAKLLRALQEREFERLGGTRTIRVDVRLIAATNCDLKAAVAEGRFREDMYYRLNVVAFRLPPLRERVEDVPLLAEHFLAAARTTCGARVHAISPAAMACLKEYAWPGNIRELQNAIERAVVLGTTTVIQPEDLPEAVLEGASTDAIPSDSYQQKVKREKRDLIVRTLEECRGNYTEAACRLSLHPNSLHRIIRNLGLKEEILRRLGECETRS